MARRKNKARQGTTSVTETTLSVAISGSVLQNIRLHARSEPQREICGVLLGSQVEGQTRVVAALKGQGANQGDAHVTFTQETWNKIHQEKDAKYPNEKIVGWYHSHPGFGVFLSDHDLFIHKNFFSQPGQLAWVFDPHSDEEGCFGWENNEIRRIKRIEIISDVERGPLGGAEPAIIPEKKDNASQSGKPMSFFGEFARDLVLIGSGILVGVVMAFVWLPSSLPVGTAELFEQIRRYQPFSVQLPDGRVLTYTPRLTGPQIAPGQDQSNPLKDRLENPADPEKQDANPMERLINLVKPEKSPSYDDALQQTGEGDEQSK